MSGLTHCVSCIFLFYRLLIVKMITLPELGKFGPPADRVSSLHLSDLAPPLLHIIPTLAL